MSDITKVSLQPSISPITSDHFIEKESSGSPFVDTQISMEEKKEGAGTSFLDTQISLAKKEPSKIKETSVFTNIVDWFSQVFFSSKKNNVDEKKADQLSSVQMQKKLKQSSELIHQIKEINDDGEEIVKKIRDPYEFSQEIGLDRAWVHAQISQIGLRKEQTEMDHEQMLKLHQAIKAISDEISRVWKERNEKAKVTLLFGKLEVGTGAFLLATSIVVAGLAFSIGTANIPGILLMISAAAAIISGGVKIYSAVLEHQKNTISAKLFGSKEERARVMIDIDQVMKNIKMLEDSIHEGWNQAHEIEKNKHQATKYR